MTGGEVSQQMSALNDAITLYVSDRYDLGAGTLTAKDVNAVLRSKGVDETLVTSIVEFLEGFEPDDEMTQDLRRVLEAAP